MYHKENFYECNIPLTSTNVSQIRNLQKTNWQTAFPVLLCHEIELSNVFRVHIKLQVDCSMKYYEKYQLKHEIISLLLNRRCAI